MTRRNLLAVRKKPNAGGSDVERGCSAFLLLPAADLLKQFSRPFLPFR